MQRRELIKYGVLGVASIGAQPLLNSCKFLPFLGGLAADHLIDKLTEFAVETGFEKMSETYNSWAGNLGPSQRNNIEHIEETLARNGFNIFSTPVYIYRLRGSQEIILYGAQNQDGIHVCAPLYSGSIAMASLPMIEAPVILGLNAAAKTWNIPTISKAAGLIPNRVIAQNPCDIRADTTRPLEYGTAVGQIIVSSKIKRDEPNKGTVTIDAIRDGQGNYLSREVDYTFRI